MAKKKFEPNSEYRVDFNQYATDKILTVFESENLNPLAMEWLSIRPYNVNKGTDYNGVNRLIMSVESALIGDPRYCPKGQVRDIGANNKGLNYDMRIKSGKTSFCAYNVQNLNNFESEYFGIASSNKTYVENDNFVEAVHNLTETVENAVTVNFELLTSIILARFMAQDINYPLGKIATSNKQWIKFLESDNTAICKASAEAQKRYNKILADCGLEDCITKVDNRFDLVLLAAHRARLIYSGEKPTIDPDNDKSAVIALREIAEETVKVEDLEEELIKSFQLYSDTIEDEQAVEEAPKEESDSKLVSEENVINEESTIISKEEQNIYEDIETDNVQSDTNNEQSDIDDKDKAEI